MRPMSYLSNDIDPNARIAQFLVDYVHDIDDGNLEAWPDYFTEDAIYQIIPPENFENDLPLGVLYCEGRGMMVDRIDALRTANIFEPHTHCHTLNSPRIRASGNVLYTARTNFTVIRTKQDGQWMFSLSASTWMRFRWRAIGRCSATAASSSNRIASISCW